MCVWWIYMQIRVFYKNSSYNKNYIYVAFLRAPCIVDDISEFAARCVRTRWLWSANYHIVFARIVVETSNGRVKWVWYVEYRRLNGIPYVSERMNMWYQYVRYVLCICCICINVDYTTLTRMYWDLYIDPSSYLVIKQS